MRIGVLDDNRDIGEMLRQGLQLYGHTVIVYSDPSAFLTNIRASTASFDWIIVDLFLPGGISGVEVIRQVWNTFPGLPIILISAGSAQEIDAARRALPTVRVLRKPFSIVTLLAMIKN